MNDLQIIIRFHGNSRVYSPGDRLSGEYFIDTDDDGGGDVRAVEASVMWYTEGKGDEDLSVWHFQRHVADDAPLPLASRPARFACTLPESPLSYDGRILKIRWCIRVRVFLPRGKEVVAQRIFELAGFKDRAARRAVPKNLAG